MYNNFYFIEMLRWIHFIFSLPLSKIHFLRDVSKLSASHHERAPDRNSNRTNHTQLPCLRSQFFTFNIFATCFHLNPYKICCLKPNMNKENRAKSESLNSCCSYLQLIINSEPNHSGIWLRAVLTLPEALRTGDMWRRFQNVLLSFLLLIKTINDQRKTKQKKNSLTNFFWRNTNLQPVI